MTSLTTFLCVYLLGGITFPILIAYLLFAVAPNVQERVSAASEVLVPEIEPDFKAGDLEEPKGVNVVKKGWITVTKKYYYHPSELTQLAQQEAPVENLPSRIKLKRKHNFYALLKHGNLFLYKDDSPDASVAHVIVLKDCFVSLWPRDPNNEAPDGSLFTKKTCIAILRSGSASIDLHGKLYIKSSAQNAKHLDSFYVYVNNNKDKEDWYFALINAAKLGLPEETHSPKTYKLNPNVSAQTAHFRTRDMLYLIQTLNSNEGQLSTKWLNALLGRLFLGLQQTETLSLYLRERLYKKLTKINKPGFLDEFVIERVDVGNAAPAITHPELREITPEGLMTIAFQLVYKGNLSLIISTKANINLGSRFKTREVTLELAVTVKEITGPMVVMIKPPPSNRIWYSFESEPVIDLDIEPVVSTKQLSYNMVTNAIKGKFREAIKESLVMPFMDDIVFYDTKDEFYRGGIWEHNDFSQETESTDLGKSKDYEKDDLEFNLGESKTSTFRRESLGVLSDLRSSRSFGSGSDIEVMSVGKESDSVSIKQKTFQRVETFKSLLKRSGSTSSNNDSDESSQDISDKHDLESRPSLEPEDSKVSKKYLNAGLKKFGRWYKDTVGDLSSTTEQHGSTEVNPQVAPQMISNRRTFPKTNSNSNMKLPQINVRRTSDAAEMFVKNKARSASANSTTGTPVNTSYRFGETPPHSPSLSSPWTNYKIDDNKLTDAQGLAIEHSTVEHSIESGSQTKIEKMTETHTKFTEETAAVVDEARRLSAASDRVDLQELNKRRPVPPRPSEASSSSAQESQTVNEGL